MKEQARGRVNLRLFCEAFETIKRFIISERSIHSNVLISSPGRCVGGVFGSYRRLLVMSAPMGLDTRHDISGGRGNNGELSDWRVEVQCFTSNCRHGIAAERGLNSTGSVRGG